MNVVLFFWQSLCDEMHGTLQELVSVDIHCICIVYHTCYTSLAMHTPQCHETMAAIPELRITL